ncbi:sulfatase family protein [Zobellia uliginosa]|uniref:sulfatase family protein n=1 Tax=Zobellia uliginosa TaxID=143224 RepID=UPI001C0743FE|nr:sulfatase [Zobellia uliginosa]MBU2947799.1 sulfatase [Zobellia uliginosa]
MKTYISKLPILTLTLSALLFFNCGTKEQPTESIDKPNNSPNIILFVSDDHGTDAIGAYGNKVIKTPNLDQLAAEGVRFNNAYCTSASCAASRSVILTGLYGHATGSYGHVHDYHHFSSYDNIKSLPVLLENSGYETARIGKYHVAPESVYHFQKVLEADPRNTVEMAEQCEDVLNSDKPFFLYFCTDDPHRGAPFESDPWNTPNSFGNKEEGYEDVETITYDPKDVVVPSFLPDSQESREEIAQYYQSVSRIDQGFGKLMKMLKETGKDKNTVVIYISDNGMAFPGAKTTVYEPGIKLPCIIKDPLANIKGGSVNNALISWTDLTPTILDMADVTYDSNDFHGKSFKNILSKENPKGWDEMYASHTFHEITMYYPMRVVRDKNYKLIRNIAWRQEYPFASDLWAASTWQEVYRSDKEFFGKRKVKDYLFRPEFELFDLSNDPDESENLANDKNYAEVLEALKNKMKDFQLKTKDPWLITWDHDNSLQGTGVNL